MNTMQQYDVICVGGGLAGLSLAILLAKQNIKVAVVEKKSYPLHRVCGEYVSLESWDFVQRLGVDLASMQLPIITQLQMTAFPNYSTESKLPLGGFGISRYVLDDELVKIAKQNGVVVMENTTVKSFSGEVNHFEIETSIGNFTSKLLVGSFGKIGVGNFSMPKPTVKNYVGIKYHINYDFAKNKIALHNFEGGYAGISAIENNKYCLCYMVDADTLKQFKSIDEMNKIHLSKNIFLKEIFNNADFLWDKPVTISNIYFGKKEIAHHNVLNVGDCAGAIPPLAGNGMSLAFRTAHLLAPIIGDYFSNKIEQHQLLKMYEKLWHQQFYNRIQKGKFIQILFAKKQGSKVALQLFNALKPLQSLIIKQTHGERF
jgi:menaquinone-9 beta-reductase